jgi:hypothetical protein
MALPLRPSLLLSSLMISLSVKKKPHNMYLVKMRSPSVPSFRK